MSEQQTVLITGGSGGLGVAMVQKFTAAGYTVLSVDRQLIAEVPGPRFIQCDLTKPVERERLWQEVTAGGVVVDVLINNAAITRAHDYQNDFTLAQDRARDEIDINFAAPIEMSRLFLAARRRQGRDAVPGSIVNIGAPGGLFPLETIPLYSATKAGLHMFTMALRRQLRGTAVKVIEVFPPSLDTGLTRDLATATLANNGAEVIAEVAAEILAGVVAGTEVILPHKQTRRLFQSLPQIDEGFVDLVNKDVKRREGWDRGG